MNFAVTLLLFRPEAPYTQILAISRGHDLTDWGLVGGKVDPGETLMSAIIREVQEESDITFGHPSTLTPVYTGLAKTRMCTTFLATRANIPEELPTSREGQVKWSTPHHIVSSQSTYHEYNRRMFKHMGIPMAFEGNPE